MFQVAGLLDILPSAILSHEINALVSPAGLDIHVAGVLT